MNLSEIEENVELIDVDQGFDLIFDLLRAYGIPKASITRLRSGNLDKLDYETETLWKGKFFADVRLDIWFENESGKATKDANEWFSVPLAAIDEAINLINGESIDSYRYDPDSGRIVLL